MRYSITLSNKDLARDLRQWRIAMADEEGKLPTWDQVLQELISRANLEDIL